MSPFNLVLPNIVNYQIIVLYQGVFEVMTYLFLHHLFWRYYFLGFSWNLSPLNYTKAKGIFFYKLHHPKHCIQ